MQELQDIYRLQAFVAAVDEGSLSAAVSKLHITQPALSARLKLLEESLQCSLLERTGRGVRPTPIGKLVYKVAVDILNQMEHLHATVKNHLELREGWVHLGGGATAVYSLFPDAIEQFRTKYPAVQFTLHEQNSRVIIDKVRAGSIDLGIVTRNERVPFDEDPDLQGLTIHCEMNDTLSLIASPQHNLSRMSRALSTVGKALLPIHLNKQPMILFEKGSAIRDIIDDTFHRAYVHPRIVMTLRSSQSMINMVERNIGLSVVSQLNLTHSSDIVRLEVEGLNMQRRLLLVSASDRTLPPAANGFLKLLFNVCVGKVPTTSFNAATIK